MSQLELVERTNADSIASKRCLDYDSDCKDVRNHFSCWNGGHFYDPHNGHVELKQVDGYCPYVFGLKS